MSITPRRWRRRIRVTSIRGASGSLIPSDLRIRLPQVYRHKVEETVVLLPDEPRKSQLHHRRGARVRVRRRGELHLPSELLELSTVQDGTVADGEHLPPERLEFPHKVVGRADRRLGLAHDAPGHRAVHGEEELAATSVDRGGDELPGRTHRVGERVERADAHDRDGEDLRERLARLDAHPQPREQPGADPDRDPADPAELDAGPGEELPEGRRDGYLVGAAGDSDLAQELPLGAERDRGLRGRGVYAEDDHAGSLQASSARSRRGQRSAHEAPLPPSPAPRSSPAPTETSSTRRWASGRRVSIASPHSTNTTPPPSVISSNPRSSTSWILSSR